MVVCCLIALNKCLGVCSYRLPPYIGMGELLPCKAVLLQLVVKLGVLEATTIQQFSYIQFFHIGVHHHNKDDGTNRATTYGPLQSNGNMILQHIANYTAITKITYTYVAIVS